MFLERCSLLLLIVVPSLEQGVRKIDGHFVDLRQDDLFLGRDRLFALTNHLKDFTPVLTVRLDQCLAVEEKERSTFRGICECLMRDFKGSLEVSGFDLSLGFLYRFHRHMY